MRYLEELKAEQAKYLSKRHNFQTGQTVRYIGKDTSTYGTGPHLITKVYQTMSGNYFNIVMREMTWIIDINCYGEYFEILQP